MGKLSLNKLATPSFFADPMGKSSKEKLATPFLYRLMGKIVKMAVNNRRKKLKVEYLLHGTCVTLHFVQDHESKSLKIRY